jgi:hypothetical protein
MEDNLVKRKSTSKLYAYYHSTKESKPVNHNENFIQNIYHDLNKNRTGNIDNYNLIVPENTLIDKSTFYQEMVNTKVQLYLNSLNKFKNESLLGSSTGNGYFTNQVETNYSYNDDINKLKMSKKKYVSYRNSQSSQQKLKPIIEQAHDEINFEKAESLYFKKINYNTDKSKELTKYHVHSNTVPPLDENVFKSNSLQNFYITDSYVTERPNAFTSYATKRPTKKVINNTYDSVSNLLNEFKNQIKNSNDKARSNLMMKYDSSLRPLKLPHLNNNCHKLLNNAGDSKLKKGNRRTNQTKLMFNTTQIRDQNLSNQVQNMFKNSNTHRKV